MGFYTLDNLKKAKNAILDNNAAAIEDVLKGEVVINGYEKQLTEYLVKINNLSLNDNQHMLVKKLIIHH